MQSVCRAWEEFPGKRVTRVSADVRKRHPGEETVKVPRVRAPQGSELWSSKRWLGDQGILLYVGIWKAGRG